MPTPPLLLRGPGARHGGLGWSGAGVRTPVRTAALALDRTLPVSLRRRVRYFRSHRHPLSLSHPHAFTEKVQWRMVYDHRELLAPTCDKLAMKAAARLPGLRVPLTYWSGTDVGELAALDLPERWVLKPNHRFGLVEFGRGRPDVAALRARTAGWLEEPRSSRGEWAYSRARRCLLVEEMVGDRPPTDYKFWVFDGQPRLVQVDTDRFGDRRQALHIPDWTVVGGDAALSRQPATAPPAQLGHMLDVAAQLGAPFDMMRVDLYDVGGQTWFGELTPYPGSGLQRFDPPQLDVQLGSLWTLPALG